MNPGAVLNQGRGNAVNPGAVLGGRPGDVLPKTPNLGQGTRNPIDRTLDNTLNRNNSVGRTLDNTLNRNNGVGRTLDNTLKGNNPVGRNLNNTLNPLDRTLNNRVGRALDNATGQRITNFRPGLNGSSLRNAPYTGNSLRLGNRSINFAANNYRPSFNRYPWYHGYWNGNRYWGNGRGWGYGGGYPYGGRLGYGRFGYGGFGLAGFGYPWYGGGYGGYGGYGYGGYFPLGWGLGGWGLGSLLYGSGYLPYSNPYWGYGGGAPYASVYDYSQPIPVAYASDAPVIDDGGGAAAPQPTTLDTAIAAFKQGNYDASLDIVDKAIQKTPSDAVLHEFRALVLFARRDFQQAAATIHSVLAVGPGWDWTTLSSLYDDVDLYTAQLRALEGYTVEHPQDAAAEFLLAYHYLTAGHQDAAKRELEIVNRLQPGDRVASDLLKMLSPQAEPAGGNQGLAAAPKPSANEPAPPVPPSSPAPAGQSGAAQPPAGDAAQGTEPDPFPPTGPPVNAATIAGSWSASRKDGSQFQLRLNPDQKFTWTFQNKQTPAQTFDGNYTVEGNVLTLERKEGGSMVAELSAADSSQFHFKLYGADDDPGLDFRKQ